MNDFFVSVSEHLPRLERNNEAFDVEGQLPDEYVIDLTTTLQALRKVKANKATGPDNVPAWILKNHANILAGPLTAIFNSSLREGIERVNRSYSTPLTSQRGGHCITT